MEEDGGGPKVFIVVTAARGWMPQRIELAGQAPARGELSKSRGGAAEKAAEAAAVAAAAAAGAAAAMHAHEVSHQRRYL